MKEAFWVYGADGSRGVRWVEVADHEQAMRDDPTVASKMGMSKLLIAELSARHQERKPFLISVMKRGAVRVRGHSSHVTVEYWCRDSCEPLYLKAIAKFADSVLAPTALLKLVNLRTMTGRHVSAGDLLREVRALKA